MCARLRPQGVLSDVAAAAQLTASKGVPLVVDEAHGAHLQFLSPAAPLPAGCPATAPPRSALSQGADLVVQSTHKVLGSLTQSAMLHSSATAREAWPALEAATTRALEQARSARRWG